MGTKNRRGAPDRQPRSGSAQPVPPQPAPVKPVPGQADQPGGASADNSQPATNTMKKGVYLSTLIYVEGNQAPADDFNSLSTSLLKKNLGLFFATPREGLTMTLTSVEVQNDVEADDSSESTRAGEQDGGASSAGAKKQEKFQF